MMHPPPMGTDTLDGAATLRQEIVDDTNKSEKLIYWSLLLLNGSVIWVYYFCVVVHSFYHGEHFKQSMASPVSTLLTLHTAWPIVVGHLLQMAFQINRKLRDKFRLLAEFAIVGACAALHDNFTALDMERQLAITVLLLAIAACVWHHGAVLEMVGVLATVVFSHVGFPTAGNAIGSGLVVSSLFAVGFICSLAEAKCYALAAFLLPTATTNLTRAVQIGNVCAGLVYSTAMAMLSLYAGGGGNHAAATKESAQLAFYVFVAFSIAVFAVAGLVYHTLTKMRCIKYYYLDQIPTRDTTTVSEKLDVLKGKLKPTWGPALVQFAVFVVALWALPARGLACSHSRTTLEKTHLPLWYCYAMSIGDSLTFTAIGIRVFSILGAFDAFLDCQLVCALRIKNASGDRIDCE